MSVQYDKEIEVTETQYTYLTKNLGGIIAHRKEAGRFYIKVWNMKYAKVIEKYLYTK